MLGKGIPWQPNDWDSALTARGSGSIPGWGTKIPQVTRQGQNRKKIVFKKPGKYYLF